MTRGHRRVAAGQHVRTDPVQTAELDHLTGDQERQHQLPGLHHRGPTPVRCAQGGAGDS
ncbi:hypothetical protein SK803_44820 [Lentzea sp. BCCO 10_0856]|uniref:Uncharacterized protein n=1 Tax=Lentzea miocenica TaxID=3095431 RepID=A0ABU4TGR8_9PSEU|nr:hypothetical protein [Lentzea sp. BCCO 10_0856]